MQKALSLASLGDLDNGRARAIIDAAIREALCDLDDRGDDEKPRFVNIRLTLKQMESGLVESRVEAESRCPKRRTASTIAKVKRDGKMQSRLVFQDGSPDNPDQRTLDEVNPQSFPRNTDEE